VVALIRFHFSLLCHVTMNNVAVIPIQYMPCFFIAGVQTLHTMIWVLVLFIEKPTAALTCLYNNKSLKFIVISLVDSRYPKLKLIDQKVPRKYRTLQEFIFAEASSMKRHRQPPIMKFDDLKKFVYFK